MSGRSNQWLYQALRAVAETNRILARGDLEAGLPEVMGILGQRLEADRVYVDQFHPEIQGGSGVAAGPSAQGATRLRVSQRHEWCAPGVRSHLGNPAMQNRVPYEPFHQKLLRGEVLAFTHSELPPEIRGHSALDDVKSFLEMPVFVRGELWGFLGFDDCRRERVWGEEEVEVLKTTAASLGEAVARAQAEARLAQSEERFRALVETSPDGIIEVDAQGTILYANRSYLGLVGAKSESQVLGERVERFLHPGYHAAVRERLRAAGDGPIPFMAEEYVRLDGTTLPIEVGAARIAGGEGRLMAIVRDTRERVAAEHALRESEARFRTVVEVSPDGVLLLEPETGRILYANPSYLRMVGAADESEVMGEPVSRFVHPDFRVLSAERMRRVLTEGGFVPLVEQKMVRLDGGELEIEATSSVVQLGKGSAVLSVLRDISQRKQAQEALKASEARFKALVQNSLDITLIVDAEGRILYASPNAPRMNALQAELGDRHSVYNYVSEEDAPRCRELIRAVYERPGESLHAEVQARLLAGGMGWFEVWGQNLSDDPAVGGIVLNVRNISERKAYQSTIEHLAYHDPLTGLPNRRTLRERAEQTLALARRGGREATLIYLDLDRFKEVNDTLGHEAGDELLVQVAQRIQGCVRQGDLLARLGGDEFALLLQDTTPAAATDVAQRVLAVLQQPFTIAETALRIGGSLGLGVFPRDGQTAEDLLRVADVAMYRAKEGGLGFMFYSPELDRYSRERLGLLHDLREGLEGGQIYLEYQPILDSSSGGWTRLEALARWLHPEKGLLHPASFIPLAEETGLIRELDRHVLGLACREAKGHGLPVAVNISARTLFDPGFVQTVLDALSASLLAPERLHLEITETALIQDLPRAVQHLGELRRHGVRISLDDFGVGNTSMGYLKDLPIDVLKIDRSFVSGIGKDPREEAILRTILSLGEGLGLLTVAEGVETPDQARWLTQRGCNLLQGFGIARPQSGEKFARPVETGA